MNRSRPGSASTSGSEGAEAAGPAASSPPRKGVLRVILEDVSPRRGPPTDERVFSLKTWPFPPDGPPDDRPTTRTEVRLVRPDGSLAYPAGRDVPNEELPGLITEDQWHKRQKRSNA